METLPVTLEDSSGANPSSVKSEDSSPRADSGRGSPPPNCAICLGTCKNKSFTDSCLHQFCFSCLLTWSKVKAECPLCKQNFKSIIHNVRSNLQYEEYMVEQRTETLEIDSIDLGNSPSHAPMFPRRFRYRTTLTFPRHSSSIIDQLLMQYPLAELYPPAPGAHRAGAGPPPAPRRARWTASFRRTVYRHNMWARPLPDFTGRFRDCSPEFYRYNAAQMHRLVPWLNRELHYLLNENAPHVAYVLQRVLDLLPRHHIVSPEFRAAMPYFGERTDHFLHELYCFASTPYDMTGYDHNVQYTSDPRASTLVNEVLSSSDSDSADSDIVMVSSSHEQPHPAGAAPAAAAAAAGPSRVIPIETISHSDTDDESVMVVGYIKPPRDRTPEVVDLLGSDSDVVLHEPAPGTSRAPAGTAPAPAPAGTSRLVKLSLKRCAAPDSDSDSDSRPLARRRRRSAAADPAWRPAAPAAERESQHSSSSASASAEPEPSPSPCSSSSSPFSTPSEPASGSTSDCSSSEPHQRERGRRKRAERRRAALPTPPAERGRAERADRADRGERRRRGSASRRARRERRNRATQTRRKGSRAARDSSARSSAEPARSTTPPLAELAGLAGAGPAGPSRDPRRLRSVVKVMPPASPALTAAASPPPHDAGRKARPDDERPLNLTVKRT